jgi:hypothetical protein
LVVVMGYWNNAGMGRPSARALCIFVYLRGCIKCQVNYFYTQKVLDTAGIFNP